MQALAAGHDTPKSRLSVTWEPPWFAVRWTDQVLPSQRSASISPGAEEAVTSPPRRTHRQPGKRTRAAR